MPPMPPAPTAPTAPITSPTLIAVLLLRVLSEGSGESYQSKGACGTEPDWSLRRKG